MKRREPLTLDMTPLVDVVFLLLIFFLVSSVFKKEELALFLNLPSVETGQKVPQPKRRMTIELSAQSIALNGRVVTMEQLAASLAPRRGTKTPVILRIDHAVPYGRVAKLLALLEKYRLDNLSLVTTPKGARR